MKSVIIIFVVSILLALLHTWIDTKIKKRKKGDIDND